MGLRKRIAQRRYRSDGLKLELLETRILLSATATDSSLDTVGLELEPVAVVAFRLAPQRNLPELNHTADSPDRPLAQAINALSLDEQLVDVVGQAIGLAGAIAAQAVEELATGTGTTSLHADAAIDIVLYRPAESLHLHTLSPGRVLAVDMLLEAGSSSQGLINSYQVETDTSFHLTGGADLVSGPGVLPFEFGLSNDHASGLLQTAELLGSEWTPALRDTSTDQPAITVWTTCYDMGSDWPVQQASIEMSSGGSSPDGFWGYVFASTYGGLHIVFATVVQVTEHEMQQADRSSGSPSEPTADPTTSVPFRSEELEDSLDRADAAFENSATNTREPQTPAPSGDSQIEQADGSSEVPAVAGANVAEVTGLIVVYVAAEGQPGSGHAGPSRLYFEGGRGQDGSRILDEGVSLPPGRSALEADRVQGVPAAAGLIEVGLLASPPGGNAIYGLGTSLAGERLGGDELDIDRGLPSPSAYVIMVGLGDGHAKCALGAYGDRWSGTGCELWIVWPIEEPSDAAAIKAAGGSLRPLEPAEAFSVPVNAEVAGHEAGSGGAEPSYWPVRLEEWLVPTTTAEADEEPRFSVYGAAILLVSEGLTRSMFDIQRTVALARMILI